MTAYFIIRNITNPPKDILIFRTKIRTGQSYDLMNVPNITEEDIKFSVNKDLIKRKLVYGDIEIVDSNINLLTFDNETANFLTSEGIDVGVIPAPQGPQGEIGPQGPEGSARSPDGYIRYIDADYVIQPTDYILLINTTNGDVNLTLPDPSVVGRYTFIISKHVNAPGSVIIQSEVGLVSGEQTQEFSVYTDTLVCISTGTEYIIG